MTLKSDENFKEKLTCSFKHDIRNLLNFPPTTQKSETFTSMGSFCPKYKGEKKKYRGDMTLNTDAKLMTLWFQNWHEELGELSLKH